MASAGAGIVKFLLLLLAIIISIILWPAFLIFIFFNEFIRAIISIFLAGSNFKLIDHGGDNFWCCEGGFDGKMIVIAFISPDGVDVNTERDAWIDRVFKMKEPNSEVYTYAKLKKVISSRFGYGCLKNHIEEFDIRKHVRILRDDVIAEEELYESIIPRLAEDMSEEKPQWEWLLIPRLEDSQGQMKSVRLLRFHHGYMDGAFSMLLFGECLFDWMAKDPNCRPPFLLDPKKKTNSDAVAKKLIIPKMLAVILLPVVMVFWCLNLAPRGQVDPFFVKKIPGKRKIMVVSEGCPRSIIRNIDESRRKLGLSSVVAYAMRPALRQLLKRRGMSYDNFTVRVDMTQAIPPHDSNIPRNQVTIARKELPLSDSVAWEDSPPSPEVLLSRFAVLFSGRMPNIVLDKLPKAWFGSCLLTSAPFTREIGTINGATIERMTPFTLLIPPEGFGIVVIGYGDEFRLTITAEENCMSRIEAKQLLEDIILDIKSAAADAQIVIQK